MLLSILICTTIDRDELFNNLYNELLRQKSDYEDIEILFERDNKEISVGRKRQILLERSIGKFIVYIDSDDWIAEDYIPVIRQTIIDNSDIDLIGYGVDISSKIKLKDYHFGIKPYYDYVVRPLHFIPVLREKALQVGFKDMRHSEDGDYTERLKPLLSKEFSIDKVMYIYQYKEEKGNKYGM